MCDAVGVGLDGIIATLAGAKEACITTLHAQVSCD